MNLRRKFHFSFFKNQRKGVLYLFILIAFVETILLFIPEKQEILEKPTQQPSLPKIATTKKYVQSNLKKDSLKSIVKKSSRKPIVKKSVKKDLNTATSKQLQKVYGIGKVLSNRIIKYRNLLQGFSMESQLYEVYGLDSLTIQKLFKKFKIKTQPKKIKKINLNKASFKQVLSTPYLNYEMTKKIFNYKRKTGGFKQMIELKKLLNLSEEKYHKTILYLKIK